MLGFSLLSKHCVNKCCINKNNTLSPIAIVQSFIFIILWLILLSGVGIVIQLIMPFGREDH